MGKLIRQPWLLGIFSAGLLALPFAIAGPAPYWRTFFAWVAFAPLLFALLAPGNPAGPRAILRGVVAAYIMGVLWYAVDCYWIYQTMLYYGGLPPLVSVGILALYSLILGLYFAAFGLAVGAAGKIFRSPYPALVAAPFFWVAVELASSRITKVPWDLLGYSQIDNLLLIRLAPVTGVYGLSFVLMAGNSLVAAGLIAREPGRRLRLLAAGLFLTLLLQNGYRINPAPAPTQAVAVLLQQNVNVDQANAWSESEYQDRVAEFVRLSRHTCGPYLRGLPGVDAYPVMPNCPAVPQTPGLIAWPETPAPFFDKDPRFLNALRSVARSETAPVVAGAVGADRHGNRLDRYNSALFLAPDGALLGRYDKVHLVPWGEYIPYKQFFSFAKNLTQEAGDMTHGWRRMVFSSGGHRFGVFICYEEIFGDEIRIFALRGAQVLVNISDDGWYGDTCAPWQTLNMSRMRAVENRRWLLRDTNTGVTTVIDPFGRMTATVQRHALTSLAAGYGYRSDLTFYTRHGDLFAELCGIISLALAAGMLRAGLRRRSSPARKMEGSRLSHAE